MNKVRVDEWKLDVHRELTIMTQQRALINLSLGINRILSKLIYSNALDNLHFRWIMPRFRYIAWLH